MQKTPALVRNLLPIVGFVVAIGGCGGGSSANTTPPATVGAGIDAVIAPFMANNGVTAITVTVVRNGQVLYDKGYGFQDAAQTLPLPSNALMVTASIVKPVTGAAIQKLAASGILNLSDHAFCTGQNAPCWIPATVLSPTTDTRAGDITIAELLAMKGGFDRSSTTDAIDDESAIQAAYGLKGPPQKLDDIRYRMAMPLNSTPGTAYSYSNFGYLVLGQIIEQASNMPYTQYVNTSVMPPLGVAATDFIAAAPLLKDHSPREPNYICNMSGPSLYAPGTTVQTDDGFINTNNWLAVGFSVTTSKAMALFGGMYLEAAEPGNGAPLNGSTVSGWWNGEWCGTQTIVEQRLSGVSYAVLMNKSSPHLSDAYASQVQSQIDHVLDQFGM